jgi:DNA-binding NtrC family response regulator
VPPSCFHDADIDGLARFATHRASLLRLLPWLRISSIREAPDSRVDDEETIRDSIARYLSARGFHTKTEDSAASALARLSQEHFEVMLCDIRMPLMSGLDVLPHALRLDGDLAVVMLTGVNDAGTATDALSQGAMDYLVKPVELAELERRSSARRIDAASRSNGATWSGSSARKSPFARRSWRRRSAHCARSR